MDTIGMRLRYLREMLGLTQAQVAEACRVSGQAVTAWERDRNGLSQENLIGFWRLTKCDLHWLLTGEGMRAQHTLWGDGPSSEHTAITQNSGRFIPMLAAQENLKLPAQTLDEILSERGEKVLLHRTQFPCGPKSFWHQIVDRANEPTYLQGDRACIDPEEAPVPGDFVLARHKDAEVLYFGEYVRTGARSEADFSLRFLNERYASRNSDEGLVIVGVMTEHTSPRRL